MILGWSLFKIVSVSAVLYPRRPPLLKIEISSNGQNCSILSQKVPKFDLYKHNDELFNIYYGILLWTLNVCRFFCRRGLQWRRLYLLIIFTEVIKFYWLMLLLYPGELYRLLGASSLYHRHLFLDTGIYSI